MLRGRRTMELTPMINWRAGGAAAAGSGVVAALAVAAGFWMNAANESEAEVTGQAVFAPPEVSDRFDAKSAFGYLTEICKLGPRITGSKPMTRQIEVLKEHFEKLGAQVELQT